MPTTNDPSPKRAIFWLEALVHIQATSWGMDR